MKSSSDGSHEVQVNLYQGLVRIKFCISHGLPSNKVLLYNLFNNGAFQDICFLFILIVIACTLSHCLLICNTNITNTLALQYQLTPKKIDFVQVVKAVKDDIF